MRRVLPIIENTAMIIAISFVVAGLVIYISGGSPFASFASLIDGSLGGLSPIAETLVKSIPLAITGIAIAIGLRAGLFNIGAEGQLFMGALAAAWIGYKIQLPPLFHIPLCLLAGFVSGAVWGLIAGILRAYRGVSEVISTIMLNYIAFYFTHYMVVSPLKDSKTMAPQTPEMHRSAWLGLVSQVGGLHWGIMIAVLCVLVYGFIIWRTRLGYEIRAVGLSHKAAKVAGINIERTIIYSMALSGAISGLAGAVEVMGVHHKFYDQFSPGYGFDSIAVALLGNNTAVGTALAALLFGILKNGALNMQLTTGAPKEIVTIIQGIIIVLAGVRLVNGKHKAQVKRSQNE